MQENSVRDNDEKSICIYRDFCSTSTIKNAEADTSDMYSAHFRAHKTVSFQQNIPNFR